MFLFFLSNCFCQIHYQYDLAQKNLQRYVFSAQDQKPQQAMNMIEDMQGQGNVIVALGYNFNDHESYTLFKSLKDFCLARGIRFKEAMNPNLQNGQISLEITKERYEYADINGDIGGTLEDDLEQMMVNPQDLVEGRDLALIPAKATESQVGKYLAGPADKELGAKTTGAATAPGGGLSSGLMGMAAAIGGAPAAAT